MPTIIPISVFAIHWENTSRDLEQDNGAMASVNETE